MGTTRPKMRKREIRRRAREIWQQATCDLGPEEDALRAARVRNLCPCEFAWPVPLWSVIQAACADPSPLVRMEALHVIEDADTLGFSDSRGLGPLHEAAQNDPDAGVRRWAKDVLRVAPGLRKLKNERTRKHCWEKPQFNREAAD